MCSYCDHDDGHTIDECPERLEEKFADSREFDADGTRKAQLREGETRDDDNTHAGDIVERQLPEADAEDLEELEDEREVRTDGGQSSSDTERFYVIERPRRDPARVVRGPLDYAEADRGAQNLTTRATIMNTETLVESIQDDGYNVEWYAQAEKPRSLRAEVDDVE